jgi:hypothetical protein
MDLVDAINYAPQIENILKFRWVNYTFKNLRVWWFLHFLQLLWHKMHEINILCFKTTKQSK